MSASCPWNNLPPLEQRSKLAYQILRSDWVADYADPKAFLEIFASDSDANHTGWKNQSYDALLTEADHTADRTARFTLLHRAETILLEESPLIPIYHLSTVRLVHPAVRGWHPTLLDHHPLQVRVVGGKEIDGQVLSRNRALIVSCPTFSPQCHATQVQPRAESE